MIVSLRPVTQQDWQFILNIRNEPEVRAACHDTSIIKLETHRTYMEQLKKDSNVYQWIVTCDGTDVGHVKIISGELGYMLKKEYRGKGLGTEFHHIVFEEAKNRGIKKLIDTIKVDNIPSLNLALKTGFKQKSIEYKNGRPYAYKLEKVL